AGASHRAAEGRVVAVDIDEGRLATASTLGATETANAAGSELAELLLELSDGVGFDVVIEASGAPDAPAAAIAGARRGGRVLLVARVLEPVVVVLRHEDDLAGPELHVGIADARDAAPRDEVLELLRVRVPVDVVLRSRREDGDPEHGVLRADGVAREQPADVHVDPAVLRAQGGIARRRREAPFHRMVPHTPDRVGHVVTSSSGWMLTITLSCGA